MKRILSNKYAPMYYQSQLLDQFFFACKQGTSNVREYLAHFETLLHSCDIYEAPHITMSRFIKGLNPKIIRHDIPAPQSSDSSYHQANQWDMSFHLRQAYHKLGFTSHSNHVTSLIVFLLRKKSKFLLLSKFSILIARMRYYL